MMRVLIAGGGTGGHVFPALSVAGEITRRSGENEVLFVGTRKGMESEIITKNGYNFEHIRSGGLVGKGPLSKISGAMKSLAGLWDSFRIIRGFRPDVVAGFGGYVSGPVLVAARILSVRTAICEQNSIPGLTNRFLSGIADRIFVSFDDSVNYFNREKTVITGNPVRNEFLSVPGIKQQPGDKITIFITGGSQGAAKLNKIIPESLKLVEKHRFRVIHQTGKKDFRGVSDTYRSSGIEADVHPFIDDMAGAYRKADLVISRAGAGAIAELCVLGKPSVLIPYPYAANNHQYHNARFMEKAGAAVIADEKDLDHMIFYELLDKILERKTLEKMSDNALKLGRPDAARKIVDEITTLAKG